MAFIRRALAALRRDRTPPAYWGPTCDLCQGSLDEGWHLASGGPWGARLRLFICPPCARDLTLDGFTVDPLRRLP